MADSDRLLADAMAQFQAAHPAAAARLCRAALAAVPHRSDALHLLGLIAYQSRAYAGSLRLIERAIRLNEGMAAYHSNLGLVMQGCGRLNDAVAAFATAIRLMPDLPDAYSNLAIALIGLGRLDEAVAACRSALRHRPRYAEAFINLAKALRKLGRLEEAAAALSEAIAIKPDLVEAHSNLGNALKDLKRTEPALASYRRALSIRPGFADAHMNLGNARQGSGDIDGALHSLLRSLQLNPDLAEARLNLGKILWNCGRRAEAVPHLGHLLGRLDAPNSPDDALTKQECISLMATHFWLEGDLSQMCNVLDGYSFIVTGNEESGIRRGNFANRFNIYLKKLLEFRDSNPDLYARRPGQPLFFIGESHAVSPHGIGFRLAGAERRGESRLVSGIKMWHVGQDRDNFLRSCLIRQIATLPESADLVFCVGEIDCRQDEGIYRAAMAGAGRLADLVAGTVDNYLARLGALVASRRPASVTIQGIPAPPADEALSADFLAMIRSVNRRLGERALALGWAFLDVYSATARPDGTSNLEWHLDSTHLRPDFYRSADRWLKVTK
jgi:tetratricopeptide (TPR) repeat protein